MHGYIGRILRVDLSTGDIQDELLNEAYARAFVGGSGLAARYIYGMVDSDTDPLEPENPPRLYDRPAGRHVDAFGGAVQCVRPFAAHGHLGRGEHGRLFGT